MQYLLWCQLPTQVVWNRLCSKSGLFLLYKMHIRLLLDWVKMCLCLIPRCYLLKFDKRWSIKHGCGMWPIQRWALIFAPSTSCLHCLRPKACLILEKSRTVGASPFFVRMRCYHFQIPTLHTIRILNTPQRFYTFVFSIKREGELLTKKRLWLFILTWYRDKAFIEFQKLFVTGILAAEA